MSSMVAAALFDLDGTLADTAPQLHAAAQQALSDMGMPPVPFAEARGFIGDGMPRFIKRLVTRQWWGEPDAAVFERAQARLEHHYLDCCTQATTYSGVPAVLERLQARAVKMACVTNKAERYTLPVLRACGVLDYFDAIICGDTLPVKKPHPAPLQEAMSRLGADAAATVMVGDSIADSRAAAAAGCKFICVSYGYHRDQLPPADVLVDDFSDVAAHVDALLPALSALSGNAASGN